MTAGKEKTTWIELLRVLACFFVIFIHTPGHMLFTEYEPDRIHYWFYQLISVFSSFAVPVFFMISGAVLIGKDESISYIWKHRILKTSAILIFFSFLAYAGSAIVDHEFSFSLFLSKLYGSYTNVAYWYLYAYIAFLASLPFIRAMARNLTAKHYYYLFGMTVILHGIRPMLEYCLFHGKLSVNGHLIPSWMFSNIVLYPLLGYFFAEKPDLSTERKYLPVLWIINFICMLSVCFMTMYLQTLFSDLTNQQLLTYHKSFVAVTSAAVFLSVRVYFESHSPGKKLTSILLTGGKYSFGIYLLHMFVSKLIGFTPLWNIMYRHFGNMKMLAALLYALIIMWVSFASAWMANRLYTVLIKR